MEKTDFSQEIQDGKNVRTIKCKYCTSVILTPSTANFTQLQFDLPTVTQKKDRDSTTETENIESFWLVDDMFTFQNVGVTNTVDNKKFLVCADCEQGPIGYHNIITKKSYVALNRVEYV
ncbi:PREDICTED: guanine nucleotide exchange factor MSS4 homolog [Nicrophorus vespilloides]|uniref:Guanine nucleotide exchange factor MSS4 homolog n=1 Tax=Nicrophorus vespilloides TaxID=110193 RepID=A0ABM1MNF7_NICVS|nr:PREDICTED: guanine nucleotide exchange factor MSS4 homolog [Nicrophorus vespilloides]